MVDVTAEAAADPPSKPLVGRVTWGLILGVAVGLFLGDRARVFDAVADGFVKLLQMAVLPYVTVSIAGSIGALRLEDLRTLGLRAAVILIGLWTIALTFAFLMPLTFPPAEHAAFFSTTLLDRPPPVDLIDLYIPANPFFALANNIVPAVVLFSIVVGVALIGLPRKQLLIDLLEATSDTLARAMRFVVRLTPYGVFAISATVAGTMRLEQAGRLQLYVIAYAALALLLGLWVLPGLVGALTPIPTRAIFRATREALMTAVIAGDLFIVLPLLITASKDLIAAHQPPSPDAEALPDIIAPVSYNFPHSGKLLSVSFVLFAGWFSDAAIPLSDYPRLAFTSMITLFGSINTAMPFLLDAFDVPADTFQLFLASGIINSRFGVLVAAMHTVAVAVLGTCAVAGTLRWQPAAIGRYVLITAAASLAVVASVHGVGLLLQRPYAGGDALARMHLDAPVEAVVHRDDTVPHHDTGAASPRIGQPDSADRLRTIADRRVLRVGYLSDSLPFAFFNGANDLVGLDVALMHRLAREMGVSLEFVPILRERIDQDPGVIPALRDGECDVIVGGLTITTGRAQRMRLSAPYMDETLALVVPDATRRRFESWEGLREGGPLTIAVPNVSYYVDKLHELLPQAHLVMFSSVDEILRQEATLRVDAFALGAERGSAWTLRRPKYSVVVPRDGLVKIPLAFALPPGEASLGAFVNTWIDLKRRDGTIDGLYQYWILGRDPEAVRPRWSIMRDLLHWVE